MADKPRRRWFTFSLRTFFVLLTVFGVWLGWNVHQVSERERLFNKSWKMHGGYYGYMGATDGHFIFATPGYRAAADRLPLTWRWIGAGGAISHLKIPHCQFSDADLARIQGLFPEAEVTFYEPSGPAPEL